MIRLTLLVLLFCVHNLHAADTWKAGFASVTITPEQNMWMSGYAARKGPSEGKETELYAKVAVLEVAVKQHVLVTLDLVGIDRKMSDSILKLIQDKYKLPREQIALNCSHTHCGPVVRDNLITMYFLEKDQMKLVQDYGDYLPKRILLGVDQAMKNLQPVTLYRGIGSAKFAVNRRENKEADVPKLRIEGKELKGPIDHDIPVITARDAQGKLTGIIFGYACHATTLSYNKWCGDYPGFAMINLEKSHEGAVAMFWAGCGADQNPIPRRTIELAKEYGKQLSDSVDAVLKNEMIKVPATIKAEYKTIDLPLHEIPNREQLIKDTMDANKYIAARAKMLLAKLDDEKSLPKTYPYPVQTWKLGSITWVFLGGEVVVDYSLRAKKELGDIWVAGYSNDVMAYIPSARVLKEGGYEGATSMIYYGLPSIWGTAIEELIMKEVTRQAK